MCCTIESLQRWKETIINPRWGNGGPEEAATYQGPLISKWQSQDSTLRTSVWDQSLGSQSPHECHLLPAKLRGETGYLPSSFHCTHLAPCLLHTLILRNLLDIRKNQEVVRSIQTAWGVFYQYQRPPFPCWKNADYTLLLHACLACSKPSSEWQTSL